MGTVLMAMNSFIAIKRGYEPEGVCFNKEATNDYF